MCWHVRFVASLVVLVQLAQTQNLKSETFNELSCPNRPIPLYEGRINYPWLFKPTTWYTPMGSERIFRSLAETFLGRAARDQAELDRLEPRVRIVLNTVKVSGFETKFFRAVCLPLTRPILTFPRNLLEQTCRRIWASPGTDIGTITGGMDSILWTDNQNALLISPCFDGKYFDWIVNSKYPTISDQVKQEVLRRIAQLGFNPENAAYYDYERRRFLPKQTNRRAKLLKQRVLKTSTAAFITANRTSNKKDQVENRLDPSPEEEPIALKPIFLENEIIQLEPNTSSSNSNDVVAEPSQEAEKSTTPEPWADIPEEKEEDEDVVELEDNTEYLEAMLDDVETTTSGTLTDTTVIPYEEENTNSVIQPPVVVNNLTFLPVKAPQPVKLPQKPKQYQRAHQVFATGILVY